mgnify:CR=1 FL=1
MVLFFQKEIGMTVFFPQCYKFREHHRRSVGVLWAFGGCCVVNKYAPTRFAREIL